MTTKQILKDLEALGSVRVKAQYVKKGAGENVFGVKMGDIRKMAKKITSNHPLALKLWETGNIEARLLSVLILNPQELSKNKIEKMVQEGTYHWLADWLNSYVVKLHPAHEELRLKWINSKDPMIGRAGWNLTCIAVRKNPEILDLNHLLDRIETEMGSAPEKTQWTMNFTLAEIGIKFPAHRKKALAIGEALGIYSDYPTAKGCTSPFAPIWINEMVSRQA